MVVSLSYSRQSEVWGAGVGSAEPSLTARGWSLSPVKV
jgi:hypothetical protein